jgi:hypothetical protein
MESPVIFGNQSEIQNICSSISYNKTNISFLNNSYVSPQVILPYLQDGDLIYQLCLSNSSNSSYCLLQLYKIRKESNISLAVHVLGTYYIFNSIYQYKSLRLVEFFVPHGKLITVRCCRKTSQLAPLSFKIWKTKRHRNRYGGKHD